MYVRRPRPRRAMPGCTPAEPAEASNRPAASPFQAAAPEPAPLRNNAAPRIPDSAAPTTEPVTLTAAAQSDPAVTSQRVVPLLVSNLPAGVGFAPHAANTP